MKFVPHTQPCARLSMLAIALGIVASIVPAAQAAVFRCLTPNGMVYQQTPCADAAITSQVPLLRPIPRTEAPLRRADAPIRGAQTAIAQAHVATTQSGRSALPLSTPMRLPASCKFPWAGQ